MKFEVSSNKIFSLNGSNKEEIHPFWLRERVSEKEYLDEGTQQRLFDPSTMRNSVEIINAEINGDFLNIQFNDGVNSKFEIKKLSDELSLNSNEIIDIKKVQWKSDFKDIKLLQVGLPVTKDLVPSIGSITQEKSLLVFFNPYSSPII